MIATVADLGVTTRRGPDWAAHDIADELDRSGHPADDALHRHPAVLDAADRFTAKISADLPPGVELLGDVIYGTADLDHAELAEHALRWKERAGYAEILADTGLWQPPDIADFPQVRIEGRADRTSPAGQHVSQLAAVAQVEYWAVYGVNPDGLPDWRADFATLTDARHHATRWQRPVTLIYTDHIATTASATRPGPRRADPDPNHGPSRNPSRTRTDRAGHDGPARWPAGRAVPDQRRIAAVSTAPEPPAQKPQRCAGPPMGGVVRTPPERGTMRYHQRHPGDPMATVQIKGRVPEDVAALFDLAVDIKAQTTHVERRHRGGVTRTVAFTQNAAVIAALTDWTEAVIDANPDLALTLAAHRLDDPELPPGSRDAIQARLTRNA